MPISMISVMVRPARRARSITRRYATVEGDHHEDLDDLLRRDTHIQSIAYMRLDLRGELDGGDRQGRDGPIPELQAWTTPDGTVQTLRADPVHIRSQIIGGGNGNLPSLARASCLLEWHPPWPVQHLYRDTRAHRFV